MTDVKAAAPATQATYPHIDMDFVALPGETLKGVEIVVDDAFVKALNAAKQRVLITGPGFDEIGAIGLIQRGGALIEGNILKAEILIESRARVVDLDTKDGIDIGIAEPVTAAHDIDAEMIEETLNRVNKLLKGQVSEKTRAAMVMNLENIAANTPEKLADKIMTTLSVAEFITIEYKERKNLLGAIDSADQLKVIDKVLDDIQSAKVQQTNKARADKGKKAATSAAEPEDEFDLMAKQIEEAHMPEEARKKAEEMLNELRETNPPMGQTFNKTKKKLKVLISVPWDKSSETVEDMDYARQVLDADHSGMNDVKEEILEHLGVQSRAGGKAGAAILLAGEPGVGKTSLGRSVAKALGREFARVSLGGVSDEAAIRGYDDNYVSAAPGKIVKAMIKTGTNNPVIMLDEFDKLGASQEHGDPEAALLEVLDPAQNNTFHDHYLDLDLDLSNVVFLATANFLDKISSPALDRMNLIELPGYTEDEKLNIAKDHLIGNQLQKTHVPADKFAITDEALKALIEGYTPFEAGVRSLEQKIGKTMRKAGLEIDKAGEAVVVNPEDLEKYIGKKSIVREQIDPAPVVGHVNGLAVTGGTYGETLPLEATMFEDAGSETGVSGNAKETMQESIKNALAFVKAHAPELGIKPETYKNNRLHVMVGAGGGPKDGPSAGLAFATLFASVWSNTPIRGDVAMTGEIGVLGQARIIGGLDKKLDGALKEGVKTAIIPMANMKDFDDKHFPQSLKDKLEIMDNASFDTSKPMAEGKVMRVIPVTNAMEVFQHALEYMPAPVPKAETKNEQSALADINPRDFQQVLALVKAFGAATAPQQPEAANDDPAPVNKKPEVAAKSKKAAKAKLG